MSNLMLNWVESRGVEKKIIIIGAGSLGRMTASILVDNDEYNINNIAFLDDGIPVGESVLDFLVIGKISDIENLNTKENPIDFIIGIANNKVRETIVERYNELNYTNVIHKTVSLSKYSTLGCGNIILPHVSIDPEAIIKNHVVINKNVTVGHNATLCDYSQACPGANLTGYVGRRVFLGLGSMLLPNIRVGENSVIGAGSVVNKDIPANCVAVGTPCKVIKSFD